MSEDGFTRNLMAIRAEDVDPPRTITVSQTTPWFLGWCRWEIVTEYGCRREVLASGRWRWKGREAKAYSMSVDADKYWVGKANQRTETPR